MVTITPVGPHADPDHGGAMVRGVGEEMAAIFGTGSRDPAPTRTRARSAKAGSVLPGRTKLVAVAAMVTATVATGIFAGNSAGVSPVAAPAPRIEQRVSRPVIRREITAQSPATEVPVAPVSSPAATPTLAPTPAPLTPTPAPPSLPTTRTKAVQPRPVLPTPRRVAAPAMPPAVRSPSVVPTATPEPVSRTSSPPAATPRSGCEANAAECLAQRIDIAENRVAVAYERAVGAGIRRRDLHRSRIVLDRARDRIKAQPGDALRLYGLVATDLENLADETLRVSARTR